jgi:hypothetical protein
VNGGTAKSTPMVHYWRGRDVNELTREELIEALILLNALYQAQLRSLELTLAML